MSMVLRIGLLVWFGFMVSNCTPMARSDISYAIHVIGSDPCLEPYQSDCCCCGSD